MEPSEWDNRGRRGWRIQGRALRHAEVGGRHSADHRGPGWGRSTPTDSREEPVVGREGGMGKAARSSGNGDVFIAEVEGESWHG